MSHFARHNRVSLVKDLKTNAMRVLAAISAPAVAQKNLSHLGLVTTLPTPAPARAPPWTAADLDLADLDDAVELDAEVDGETDAGQDLEVAQDLADLPDD